jgi:hypothetical protein
VEGPAGLFSFDGLSQPEVSFSGGGLKTSARGYRRITFASDGGVIEVLDAHAVYFTHRTPKAEIEWRS